MYSNQEIYHNIFEKVIIPEFPDVKGRLSRITKFSVAKNYIQNWTVLRNAAFGKKYDLLEKIIKTKDGRTLQLKDRDDLIFLIDAIYYCHLFLEGYEVIDYSIRLHQIARLVKLGIREKWGKDLKGIGGWPASKEVLLYLLVRKSIPTVVVETGVAQGVSSTFILNALEDNGVGTLTSIDLPNLSESGQVNGDGDIDYVHVKEDLGVGWIVPKELREKWTLILGDAKEELEKIALKPDLFFHDSDHSYGHMMYEFEWALSNLSPNGIVLCDDISWNQSFRDFISKHEGVVRKVFQNPNVGIVQLNRIY